MKVFLCNFFAVKAKSFYRQCLVKLLNKSICSECGLFCIFKLSGCPYFSPFPQSALPLPVLRNADTCTWVRSWLAFARATTNNHRNNSSPPLLEGDGCCAKGSPPSRMGGQMEGSRTLLSIKRSHRAVRSGLLQKDTKGLYFVLYG